MTKARKGAQIAFQGKNREYRNKAESRAGKGIRKKEDICH